jgi:PST family polysaccharide transporter
MMIYTTSGLIHLSIGRADRWLRWVIVEFVVTVLLFVAGLHWGPVGVASAWTVSFWILTIPAFWYAGRPIRFGVAPVIAVTWRYAIASLISGGLSFEIMQRLVSVAGASGVMGALARIITASFLFLTFYIAAVIAFYGGPAPVYRLAKIMPDLLPLGSLRRSLSKRDSAVPEDIRKGESVFEKVERLPDEAGQDRVTELR